MSISFLPLNELKEERKRIAALQRMNILDTEEEEEYSSLVKVASFICQTPVSLISLIDESRQWFKARHGFELKETARDVSFCSYAIQSAEVMVVEDATKDSRFRNNPLVTGDPSIRFYAGAPLVTSDGYSLGTLCVIDREPKSISPEQKECLVTLSKQIVRLMEMKAQKTQLLQLNNTVFEELEIKMQEQEKVLQLFSRFVPDEVVARHLTGNLTLENDAEHKQLTVMFCDIRGYTTMVENSTPSEAVKILGHYYSVVSEIITTYSGMVNQYVGDEVFSTFGSPFSFPSYERNAVFCALAIIAELDKLNELCRPFTDKEIKVGIGIHSGEVITGTLGSAYKIEYAVTGDTVNTGKRIEMLTQNKPNTILISQPVYDQVKDIVTVVPWEPIMVKGRKEPVTIYEVTGRIGNEFEFPQMNQ